MKTKPARLHQPSGVPAAAGRIAHEVIAEALASTHAGIGVPELALMVSQRTECLGKALNATRVRALALTSASKYLQRLRPACATFVGAEVTVRDGRMDLLWRLPDGTLFADELKTERFLNETSASDQGRRYVTAGRELLGDGFRAVRIISTTQQRRGLLIASDLSVLPLKETPYAIEALRGRFEPSREVAA